MTAVDHSTPLRQAVISALLASQDVQDLVDDRVFDYVPQNAKYNYIRVGTVTAVGYEDSCSIGMEGSFLIHGFITGNPNPDTSSTGNAVAAVLDDQTLTFDNVTAELRLDGFQVLPDSVDQTIAHAVWRYNAVTRQDR